MIDPQTITAAQSGQAAAPAHHETRAAAAQADEVVTLLQRAAGSLAPQHDIAARDMAIVDPPG